MIDRIGRLHQYDDIVQRLAGALRSARLYAAGHPKVTSLVSDLLEPIRRLHAVEASLLIGFVGGEIIADDTPLDRTSASRADLTREMSALGIQRILLERGITAAELVTFIETTAKAAPTSERAEAEFVSLPHLKAGRIPLDPSGEGSALAGTVRQVYLSAVAAASRVWESACTEGTPDLLAAKEAVEHLAEAVTTTQWVMLGLTSMKEHDDYTFTHMVNVSILTLAQGRSLGIEGDQLRDIGLAALLHDIGKIRTPREILRNTSPLTDRQFSIIKRHPVDGATILRCTPGMPPIAPIVALEHHLRLDGTGYPERSRRTSLNLATMICGIADIYDAMRSTRTYQEAFAPDRIIAVMQRNDGRQFDQRLVNRFIRLLGMYPPGTLVELSSGEVGVVQQTAASDPYRPTVRLLFDRTGRPFTTPDARLWRQTDESTARIVASVEASRYQVDPLPYLISA